LGPTWLGDIDSETLAQELERSGFPRTHASKLLRAFYHGDGEIDFDQRNVGPRVARWVRDHFGPRPGSVSRKIRSADGTTKLLITLPDGRSVESVLMPGYRPDRAACCVSSQIGCAMGCDFCASTLGGLERNLTAGEIVDQFLHLKAKARQLGRRLTSLVFMGMGEPMHNLDNVILAIGRIADPELGGLGWRQVTVSTVGIVPGIDRLAEADLNVHLALSLHAPDDSTRDRLVPANRRYKVADIMAAVRRFADRTGRVPTIEYCMLAGVNDSDAQATELARLVAGFRVHVNLIPYNPIGAGLSGFQYARPEEDRIESFLAVLRQAGVVAHRRDTRGDDVSAACGQLRRRELVPEDG
jgi:23S rRNA (adenine2503-C2)-methyltransferase